MKPRFSNQRNHALTLVEVLVVIVVLAILAAVLLPKFGSHGEPAQRLPCVNNLKEIGLSYRIWAGDNNDKFPMQVSITNGGAMELIATGNVISCFQAISNELSTPKILICPEDSTKRTWATNFTTDFNNHKISYFVGVDATNETNPQMFLSGDDNLAIDAIPVKSGLLELSTNSSVTWNYPRHTSYKSHFWTLANYKSVGYIGFADGSVEEATSDELENFLHQTGLATNRLAIP
jgi:prepilin-type N-terminal cleavage/methylation domain-containing protein